MLKDFQFFKNNFKMIIININERIIIVMGSIFILHLEKIFYLQNTPYNILAKFSYLSLART